MPRLQVAIDGTAGAGKTTIGQMLATQLNCPYLDTGAMYRAVSLLALQANITLEDKDGLAQIARAMNFSTREATPTEATDGRQYTVMVDGEDVSQKVRSSEVEAIVSQVAAVPQVRSELVTKQREIAEQAGTIVMIGRDIGSVVLPNASLKVYLDASPEVRASRRVRQSGLLNTEQAKHGLEQRDRIDSQRTTAPLVIAAAALYINTDNLSQEEVLAQVKAALAPLLD